MWSLYQICDHYSQGGLNSEGVFNTGLTVYYFWDKTCLWLHPDSIICIRIDNVIFEVLLIIAFELLWPKKYIRIELDSILEAVLTVSPNKQYLGIFKPTTPATTAPEKH